MSDHVVFDTIQAYAIEDGDQIVVDGDLIERVTVTDGDDPDEVILTGYSNETGDRVTHSLYAFDSFDVWGQ